MSDNTVLPPTPEIRSVIDLLDQAISRFLDARLTISSWGTYESDVEAINLMNLVIRDVEGVITLAKRDLVMLPAAMVIARTAFEIAIRILWMLDPTDPFEREVRWLVHLQNEEENREKMAKILEQIGLGSSGLLKRRDTVQSFRTAVTSLLPQGYKPYKKLPDLRAMMREIKEENQCLLYAELSQFTHGTHIATGIYRKNLGIAMDLGEFITPNDWHTSFDACSYSLFSSGSRILERLGGNPAAFITSEFATKVQQAIQKVKTG